MPLPLPCPDQVTAGTMLLWKVSSPTSKKKLSGNILSPALQKQSTSLMTIFTSTTTNASNSKQDRHLMKPGVCLPNHLRAFYFRVSAIGFSSEVGRFVFIHLLGVIN